MGACGQGVVKKNEVWNLFQIYLGEVIFNFFWFGPNFGIFFLIHYVGKRNFTMGEGWNGVPEVL